MFDVENPPEEALDPLADPDQDPLTPEEAQARAAQELMERMQLFEQMLCSRRQEAVQARAASGVERQWLEDQDSYQGRDSMNRRTSVIEAAAAGGAVSPRRGTPNESTQANRSTVFVQLTRQKTNAAAARCADMLYPTDDRNWGIKPTPVPELMEVIKGRTGQQQVIDSGQALMHPDAPDTPLTYAALAAEQMTLAAQKAKLMQDEIDDQLTECQYNYEGRKVIQDAAMLGTGILKGPSVVNRVAKKWAPQTTTDAKGKSETVQVLEMVQEIRPRSYRVDPWNFFPDPACGENIQDGSYVYEREYMPGRELARLAKVPGFNSAAIMACLREGPQTVRAEEGGYDARRADDGAYDRAGAYDDKRFELWTYTGDVSREDLIAAGVEVPDDESGWLTTISGVMVICNNRVIKAMLNPLDTGDFPYDVFVWERVALSPFGVGIPYLMRYAQRTLNAAWRAMLDNMALSAGPQIVMNKKAVTPADGAWALTSRKLWFMNDGEDVQKAFWVFEIPSHQQEISNIIDLAQRFADEETSLPQIAQGEQGTAPETVGGMSILMNSANTVLRRLVKQFDDMVTRPHIRRYYDWNMQYNPKEQIKGDFEVDARGSSVLIVRDQQQQAVMQLFNMAESPTFGIFVDPEKLFKKGLEMNHLTPDDVMRTEAEIQQKQTELAQQKAPPDPRVQAATIAANARVQEAQISTQGEQAYIATQQQIARDDHAATMAELEMKRELAILDYANKNQMQLNQVKADLAMLAIKLNHDGALKTAERQTQAAQTSGPASAATPQQSPDAALQ